MELLMYGLLSVGINAVMFVPAFAYKTDRFTDISYALSFIVLACIGALRSNLSTAHIILLIAVILWAARLGGFLLFRIWKIKSDKRFDGMRDNFLKFLSFWLLQGISVFVVLSAALLIFGVQNPQVSLVSYVGLFVFVSGLVLEATADIQKYRFNADPKNKDKWIERGVWKYSRHPNYLGEMMVWIGIYIYGASMLNAAEKTVALVSPAYIIGLLLFVSGVPLLEKAADKKWGSDPAYRAYKKRTPAILIR